MAAVAIVAPAVKLKGSAASSAVEADVEERQGATCSKASVTCSSSHRSRSLDCLKALAAAASSVKLLKPAAEAGAAAVAACSWASRSSVRSLSSSSAQVAAASVDPRPAAFPAGGRRTGDFARAAGGEALVTTGIGLLLAAVAGVAAVVAALIVGDVGVGSGDGGLAPPPGTTAEITLAVDVGEVGDGGCREGDVLARPGRRGCCAASCLASLRWDLK
mmetsp:Transcript_56203/g.143218  ORF Transcript_56203/g.143218 Transcript_56203/m.143218 type:complete len:218 (-) Transcript_56203:772-1425(-)